ncbi:MAG: hypothetical protein HY872_15185 [Chloroflexi bacterium]|nr:hypothetical protein [Chloroflexota bacterium]MBI5828041.1 hypothetical protein [Chloroflexota bacterium]
MITSTSFNRNPVRLLLCAAMAVTALAACNSPSPTAPAPAKDFHDTFAQDLGLWETFTEGNASAAITGGQLVITVAAPSSVGLSLCALNVSDFDLTVTASQASGGAGNSLGAILRYTTPGNFYRFDVTGDGLWGFSRRQNNDWVRIVGLTQSSAINTGGGANLLRVTAHGSRFEFYANGALLGRATDTNETVGRVGLFAASFDDPNIQAAFDDITVSLP